MIISPIPCLVLRVVPLEVGGHIVNIEKKERERNQDGCCMQWLLLAQIILLLKKLEIGDAWCCRYHWNGQSIVCKDGKFIFISIHLFNCICDLLNCSMPFCSALFYFFGLNILFYDYCEN